MTRLLRNEATSPLDSSFVAVRPGTSSQYVSVVLKIEPVVLFATDCAMRCLLFSQWLPALASCKRHSLIPQAAH